MQRRGALDRIAGQLRTATEQQQMMQSGVQSVRVGVLEPKPRAQAKAGFAVQYIWIRRASHDGIHGFPHEVERLGIQLRVQYAVEIRAITPQECVSLASARTVDQFRFKYRDIVLLVSSPVNELVLLPREKPQQRSLFKTKAASVDHVDNCAAHHEIQLQLDVPVTVQSRRITRRFSEEKHPVVTRPEVEILQHNAKNEMFLPEREKTIPRVSATLPQPLAMHSRHFGPPPFGETATPRSQPLTRPLSISSSLVLSIFPP